MKLKPPTEMAPEPCLGPCDDLGTLQRKLAQRARDLRNPRWGDPRRFPVFRPGWTTAGYIAHYEQMNSLRKLAPVEYIHARGHAAPVEVRTEE